LTLGSPETDICAGVAREGELRKNPKTKKQWGWSSCPEEGEKRDFSKSMHIKRTHSTEKFAGGGNTTRQRVSTEGMKEVKGGEESEREGGRKKTRVAVEE